MIQPGLNLFELLPRKVHGAVLMLGGLVNLSMAVWEFSLRTTGGVFGVMNINNIQAVATWVPDWLIAFHKTQFSVWLHIVVFALIGLAVFWEGIKMWKTGK